ncbi:MAG: D-sedoheptulose 7-phosphate isomerase [Desulfovibrionales bacterium]|nr:D-sedoheptulose 7-phosphate isomerase [Desulfovibrionales bacterium]
MTNRARQIIMNHAHDGARLREAFFSDNAQCVDDVARAMAFSLTGGGKILFCGNGGSAADAQHLAAEMVNRFLMERPPLPAIALTTDTSALTAIANDYSFAQVFSKQVQALGRPGDVLIGISTSGQSPNVNEALRVGLENGLVTVGLGGGDGGGMVAHCRHALIVPDSRTPLVQEVHAAIGHLLCWLVDHYLFEAVAELDPGLIRK